MLVNGKWSKDFEPVQSKDKKGGFVRKDSSFRHWIGDEGFPPEADRYHLIIGYICPWASRTLALRNLKGLQDIIPVSVVEPVLTDQGWTFGDYPGSTGADTLLGAKYLHEFYSHADDAYTGRATVPVLWDTKTKTIVNNESSEIVKILNSAFNDILPEDKAKIDLYPEDLRTEIDEFNDWIYPTINNGVYRTGFATTQEAYEEAYDLLFNTLDELESKLSDGRKFAIGDQLTLTDIHLFMTLIRFDVAYYGLFKTNKHHIADYPHIAALARRLYDIPEIKDTVNFEHIVQGYASIKAINPLGLVPQGPDIILGSLKVQR